MNLTAAGVLIQLTNYHTAARVHEGRLQVRAFDQLPVTLQAAVRALGVDILLLLQGQRDAGRSVAVDLPAFPLMRPCACGTLIPPTWAGCCACDPDWRATSTDTMLPTTTSNRIGEAVSAWKVEPLGHIGRQAPPRQPVGEGGDAPPW